MTDHSRRKFLTATSIGGAAAGAAVLLPRLAAQPAAALTAQDQASAAVEAGPAHAGPFVAYVKDAKTGDIAVLAGEHEIVHRDVKLAAQLAKVAARAPQA